MGGKMPSLMTSVTVDRATFHREPIDKLTFVNFFYGGNGTGKSSIARAIAENDGVEWAEGCSPKDYDALLYNREFVDQNFSSYGDIKGVFTLNKANVEIQGQIDAKAGRKRELEGQLAAAQDTYHAKTDALAKLLSSFQNTCWSRTAQERADFEKALDGKKTKRGFADAILAEESPAGHDPAKLKRLCDAAFDVSARTYPEFQRVDGASAYGTLPGRELLDQVIVSSADTTFARFVRRIKASDWVREGHAHYVAGAEGKCPFCQQRLPDAFEEDIRRCYDGQYQQDVSDLMAFRNTYDRETAGMIRRLQGNMADVMPSLDLSEYRAGLELLAGKAAINTGRLAEKIKEPSRVIALEDTDSLLLEIGILIDDINRKIRANNDVVNARRAGKEKCRREVMAYLAFLLQDTVKSYLDEKSALEKAAKTLAEQGQQIRREIAAVDAEIARLHSQTVNTQEAAASINRILKEAGFQGFSLRAKPDVDNTYEVIREDGGTAEDLSEGERNMIAFLYFYHLVRGSHSREGSKDKIVVIDDPVSGMDSAALFLVGSIVREMINACRDSAAYQDREMVGVRRDNAAYQNRELAGVRRDSIAYQDREMVGVRRDSTAYQNPKASSSTIRQIFVLTHNVYFHREITCRQTGDYDCTSFYIIRKSDNVSKVYLCERGRKGAPKERENYNPVQNSYAALWEELRETDAVIPALSIMRRILSYYFVRLCGYEGGRLREELLESAGNREKFLVGVSGGGEDGRAEGIDYQIASSMLAYLDPPSGIDDGILLVEEQEDIDAYRRVFRLIFDAMGQRRHYDMMMGQR